MPATGDREGGHLSKGWLPSLAISEQELYREQEGAPSKNSTVSSDSHLQIGHRWSDQCHFDCFSLGTVNLQCQGPFVPISLWPVLRIVTTHVLGTV